MICEWHKGEADVGEWFYDEILGKEIWVCRDCLDDEELDDDDD